MLASVSTDVFQFLDYRTFLRQLVEKMRLQGQYSARRFAAAAGFKSANYMKLILDGKRNLTEKNVEKFIEIFALKKPEAQFFRKLVTFNQSLTDEAKHRAFLELLKFKRFQKVKSLELAQYDYFSRWYLIALYIALGTSWRSRPLGEMAHALGISLRELNEAIQLLHLLKLIEKKDGLWHSKDWVIESPEEMRSLQIRNLHREMLKKGIESLDKIDPDSREVGSLTLALSPENFEDLRGRLRKIRQELSLLYAEEKNPKTIYQLNLVLFPLLKIED